MSGTDIVRIAQEVSPEAAERLMRAFGGRAVYVPRLPGPAHAISQAIGTETAREIARILGPGRLEVPQGARAEQAEKAARVVAMIRAHRSEAEIARAVGVSVRTVRRWRRRVRQSGRA